MKLQGSLACLLLALCLGSGKAGPLSGGQGAGAGAAQGVGDGISYGVGEAVGQGAGQAASSRIQEAAGQGGGDAVSSGIQEFFGQGHGGEGSSGFREARGDALSHRLGEAARSLDSMGSEAGRQAEDVIRRGLDAAHNSGSWGTSGGHGMYGSQGGQGNLGRPGTPWSSESSFETNSLGGSMDQGNDGSSFNYETNPQGAVAQPGYGSVRGSNQNSGCTNPPPSGSSNSEGSSSGGNSGHGSSSQGHGSSGGSSSHGSSSHGSNGGGSHGSSSGSRDLETSNFDEGYSVSRGTSSSSSGSRGGSGGGNKPECDNPGNDSYMSGGSRSQESRESSRLLGGEQSGNQESRQSSRLLGGEQSGNQGRGSSGDSGRNEAINGLNTMNSDGFNFDSFWENFKSKLGFINWDAINKGRAPPPSTRALLYFRRLWENFKRRTPFFNWKEIEDSDVSSLQKRAGGADQNYNYNQQVYPVTHNWQYYAKTTAKGGATPSSSASRVQPGLLQWLKFW